jgi:transcriptional regulator with XRE-family HTH domain
MNLHQGRLAGQAVSVKPVGMTPTQCRAARTMLRWTQPQLARAAGLGLSTIVDFERERRKVSRESIDLIRIALEVAGARFDVNGGVKLRRP